MPVPYTDPVPPKFREKQTRSLAGSAPGRLFLLLPTCFLPEVSRPKAPLVGADGEARPHQAAKGGHGVKRHRELNLDETKTRPFPSCRGRAGSSQTSRGESDGGGVLRAGGYEQAELLQREAVSLAPGDGRGTGGGSGALRAKVAAITGRAQIAGLIRLRQFALRASPNERRAGAQTVGFVLRVFRYGHVVAPPPCQGARGVGNLPGETGWLHGHVPQAKPSQEKWRDVRIVGAGGVGTHGARCSPAGVGDAGEDAGPGRGGADQLGATHPVDPDLGPSLHRRCASCRFISRLPHDYSYLPPAGLCSVAVVSAASFRMASSMGISRGAALPLERLKSSSSCWISSGVSGGWPAAKVRT